MRRVYPEFVQRLNEAISKHANGNKSEFARLVNVDRGQVSATANATIPASEVLARAVGNLPGESLEEWLNLAGFGEIPPDPHRATAHAVIEQLRAEGVIPDPDEDPLAYFNRLYRDLCRRHNRVIPFPSSFMGGEFILRTRQAAEDLIAAMEEDVAKGEDITKGGL
jgi:hypothetical protein